MSRTTTHTHDCAICGQRFACWGTWQPNDDCPPYCEAHEASMTYRCPRCRGIHEDEDECNSVVAMVVQALLRRDDARHGDGLDGEPR